MKMSAKKRLKRSIVYMLSKSSIPAVLPKYLGGVGFILMLHRVRPISQHAFSVHGSLEITPDFLVSLIERLRAMDIELVDLDEAARRLETDEPARRFACITLDDGYRDNYEYARPIFEKYEAPYTVYLTTGLPDQDAIFWWLVLEEMVRAQDRIAVWIDGDVERHDVQTIEAKHRVYAGLHKRFRDLPATACAEAARRLCDDIGLDPAVFCAQHGMSWDMVREIASSRIGHIEAHTMKHMAVSCLSRDAMIRDIEGGIDRTMLETGVRPKHFAYPFGDRLAAGPRDFAILGELPLVTATTTIEGVLHRRHRLNKHSLPRLGVNGYYQSDDYLNLLFRGVAPLLSMSK